MSNIKLVRLISGEEVMGDISTLDGYYTINEPVALRWVPSQEDPQVPKLMMASLIPHSEEDDVHIHERHVLFEIEPVEELVSEYNALHSNIITPPKKELIV